MCYIQKDKYINDLIKNEIEGEVIHTNNNIEDFDFLIEPQDSDYVHTFKVVLGLITFGLMMSKIFVVFLI
tara:strand:+ start:1217 stop:1426 length:210 start_codon:yes stop_codon:yes gene_type:complete